MEEIKDGGHGWFEPPRQHENKAHTDPEAIQNGLSWEVIDKKILTVPEYEPYRNKTPSKMPPMPVDR